MIPTAFRPEEIFACLVRHEVRFIVVGGLAGVAQDAGWPTKDADIVIETSEENQRKLLAALEELEAEYDTLHRPPIRPDWSLVSGSTGPQLFRTQFGRLDVLKEAGGETFESLTKDAVAAQLFGSVVRCASLEALLRMKRAANRPKDKAGIELVEERLRQTARSRAAAMDRPLADIMLSAWRAPHRTWGDLVYLFTEDDAVVVFAQSLRDADREGGIPGIDDTKPFERTRLGSEVARELERRIRSLDLEWPAPDLRTSQTRCGLFVSYEGLELTCRWYSTGKRPGPARLSDLHSWAFGLLRDPESNA